MPLMIFVFLRSVIHEELPLFQAGRLSPCCMDGNGVRLTGGSLVSRVSVGVDSQVLHFGSSFKVCL